MTWWYGVETSLNAIQNIKAKNRPIFFSFAFSAHLSFCYTRKVKERVEEKGNVHLQQITLMRRLILRECV